MKFQMYPCKSIFYTDFFTNLVFSLHFDNNNNNNNRQQSKLNLNLNLNFNLNLFIFRLARGRIAVLVKTFRI